MITEVPGDKLQQFLDKEDADSALFLELFENCKGPSLELIFESLGNSALSRFWKKIFDLVSSHTILVLGGDLELSTSHPSEDSQPDNKQNELSQRVLLAVTKLATAACSSKSCQTDDHLLNSIVLLHSLFANMDEAQERLRMRVLELCEHAWKQGLPRKEELATNTIQVLLFMSLQPKASRSVVNRVWNVRQCLTVTLQLQNKSSVGLLTLLEKCFKSSIYLDSKQGQKMLSWILERSEAVLGKLHPVIKSQLRGCSMKHAEAYGRIYYQAWANSQAKYQKKLEEDCLCDIVNTTMYFNRKAEPAVFSKLCKFLSCFHEKRNKMEVAAMLIRVYDPIIWRSLKVANCIVRGNAAHLMFDVFPLVGPESKNKQELSYNKQYNEMESLLKDSVPEVRCIAALGIFDCLRVAWESFPPEVIRKWLQLLLGPCLHDGNSSQLRYSVIKGLSELIDNPLCHQTLKALLPSLGKTFHDICDKVREAFCVFLLKINGVEGFKYWDVVPVEELLSRLEEDTASICELIVKLTCKNLLPPNKLDSVMLERSCYLFKTNVMASRVYIRQWCLVTELEVVVSFLKLWDKTVLGFVMANNKSNESLEMNTEDAGSLQDQDEAAKEATNSLLEDPHILSGMLSAMCIAWKTAVNQLVLPENKALLKDLMITFELSMPKMLLFFRESPSEIWSPLLLLASSLKLEELRPHLSLSISRLEKLDPVLASEKESSYSCLVGSLIYQGRSRQLLELCLDWLARGLFPTSHSKRGSSTSLSDSQAAKRKKRVQFEEKPAKPDLAIRVLAFLLKYPELQQRAFAEQRNFVFQELLPVLQNIKGLTEHFLSTEDGELPCPKPLLVQAFALYFQLILLMHKHEGAETVFDSIRAMQELQVWISESVLPHVGPRHSPPSSQSEYGSDQQTDVSKASSQTEDREGEEEAEQATKRRSSRRKRQVGKKQGKRSSNKMQHLSNRTESEDTPLPVQIVKEFLACISDMVLLEMYTSDFLTSVSTFVCNLIKSEKGGHFLWLACRFLCVVVDQAVMKEVQPPVSILSSLISSVIWKIGSDYFSQSSEVANQSLMLCKKPLVQALHSLFQHFGNNQQLVGELLGLMLASIMGNISNGISKMELKEVSELETAPPLTVLILEQLLGRSQVTSFLAGALPYLENAKQPLQVLAFVCCLFYIQDMLDKQKWLRNVESEFVRVLEKAKVVLLRIAYEVKERHDQAESMEQIPEVLYCRFCQKMLKKIKQQVNVT